VTPASGRASVAVSAAAATGDQAHPDRLVDPRGRAKVVRPMPAAEREAAVARGLAAYARGDFYLAHEELEPAWMATTDTGERELLGGLIKVAAAFVHASRGNPAGARTNLRGARERLAGAAASGRDGGLDLEGLLVAIDDRLARLAATPESTDATDVLIVRVPDPPHDVAGPPGRSRRPPLALEPPTIERSVRA
jgi:predicted metal-dependent hydrolase